MTTVMLYFGINMVSAVKDAEVVITSILKDFCYFLMCRAFDLQMQLWNQFRSYIPLITLRISPI